MIAGSVFSVSSRLRRILPDYNARELRRIIAAVNGGSRLEQIAERAEVETQRALTYLLHLQDAGLVGAINIRDTSGNYNRQWYRR